MRIKTVLLFLMEFQFSFWIFSTQHVIVKYVYVLLFCSVSRSTEKSSQSQKPWTIFPQLLMPSPKIYNLILLPIVANWPIYWVYFLTRIYLCSSGRSKHMRPSSLACLKLRDDHSLATLMLCLIKITSAFLLNHWVSPRTKHFYHCLYLSKQ